MISSRTCSGFRLRKSSSVSPSRDFSSASRTFFGIECVSRSWRSWDGAFAETAFRPSTPSITIPRPRTIWKACADGLWRLFLHLTMFRSRDGLAWSLLNFKWTTQSARYIGITVSGPARSPGPCSSSVQRTVPTFLAVLQAAADELCGEGRLARTGSADHDGRAVLVDTAVQQRVESVDSATNLSHVISS